MLRYYMEDILREAARIKKPNLKWKFASTIKNKGITLRRIDEKNAIEKKNTRGNKSKS